MQNLYKVLILSTLLLVSNLAIAGSDDGQCDEVRKELNGKWEIYKNNTYNANDSIDHEFFLEFSANKQSLLIENIPVEMNNCVFTVDDNNLHTILFDADFTLNGKYKKYWKFYEKKQDGEKIYAFEYSGLRKIDSDKYKLPEHSINYANKNCPKNLSYLQQRFHSLKIWGESIKENIEAVVNGKVLNFTESSLLDSIKYNESQLKSVSLAISTKQVFYGTPSQRPMVPAQLDLYEDDATYYYGMLDALYCRLNDRKIPKDSAMNDYNAINHNSIRASVESDEENQQAENNVLTDIVSSLANQAQQNREIKREAKRQAALVREQQQQIQDQAAYDAANARRESDRKWNERVNSNTPTQNTLHAGVEPENISSSGSNNTNQQSGGDNCGTKPTASDYSGNARYCKCRGGNFSTTEHGWNCFRPGNSYGCGNATGRWQCSTQ